MEILRFGTFELNHRTRELWKRGVRLPLQDLPLRVLCALIERPGEVVGRSELTRRLWPGNTGVDVEHSLNAAVRRLRLMLGDQADIPRFVETVHKRGYRFIAVSHTHVAAGPDPYRPPAPATIAHIVRRARLAVLPFGPFDGFTDGLTEEAITQLAQRCPRSIGVIARTSVEHARREGGSAAQIGRALGADYLVEGSVRREGDRIRVTAQLIESDQETHLWAKTFDRVMGEHIALQAELAGQIADAVTAELSESEDVARP